ncbi:MULTISPECIES: ABC transporter permease [Thermoanaerobacterium]|uniref:ABC transporter permease n=2 Tax=Thermoanaerobacterium TaxID=28895 RepID=W9ECI8_9THEO|nr:MULTISPECIES: ABC transporter permease subunit [Thermoanaerobacterium]AFK85935.1 hypothetical protein Tsac_0919 [Thermoanaerobacterium saccharolyticum JW/SL-YS485]ETO38725.1 hypothetical protein V518_1147 [Thermoanaerobacterium aotearoense SCUT27]
MLTMAKYTIKEMIKKRAFLLIAILTVGYLFIYGYGLSLAFDGNNQVINNTPDVAKILLESQLLSIGLYFSNFIIAFLIVLTSAGAISGDVESGAIYAVLAKPIKRHEYVLGKFIGLLTIIVVYSTLLFLSIIGLNIAFGTKIYLGLGNVFRALFFFNLGPVVLLSLVIASSSVMSTVNTGILAVMAYGIAMIGDVLEQSGAVFSNASAQSLINIGIITSLILPTNVIFRKMNAVLLTQNTGLIFITQGPLGGTSQPSPIMFVYIALYICFLLYYGTKKFEKRNL